MTTETEELKEEIRVLKEQLQHVVSLSNKSYYYSNDAVQDWGKIKRIPENGHSSEMVKDIIENHHVLDFNQNLNTSSYVNVSFEKEEEEIALLGLRVNLADQTVYPKSYELHDTVVNMIARMWHCPEPDSEGGQFAGAGTVGSTEACLLAGLALKFRWREWYAKSTD